jgi:hypothetical protein
MKLLFYVSEGIAYISCITVEGTVKKIEISYGK